MVKKLFSKKQKGIAMITIMITIMFLSVIATAMLYISSTNLSMKSANTIGKKNYYETDSALLETTTAIRNRTMSASSPLDEIKQLTTNPTGTLDASNPGHYDVTKVTQLIYPSASGSATNCVVNDLDSTGNVIGDYTFTAKGGQNVVTVEGPTSGVTKFTFKNMEVIHTSTDGYQNSVKTDMVFEIYERVTPSGGAGGVGNMSMLLDSNLSSSAANFKCLTMTGNCFMADFSGGATGTSPALTHSYVKPGSNALSMTNESRLNLKGGNNVIYGDVNLTSSDATHGSSLVVYGKLTVYGDIHVSNGASLIIAEGGELYQPNWILPGRSTPPVFDVGTNNVFPAGLTPTPVSTDNFQNFTETLNLDTTINTTGEYGLIKKIFKKNPGSGISTRLTDLGSAASNINTFSITGLDNSGSHGSYDLSRGYFMSSFYGGDGFGVAFLPYGINTSSMNGGFNASDPGKFYDHKLMISLNNSPLNMQQSNPYTTWISNTPVTCSQAHCITLSKVGTDQFNYMTAAKGDPESVAYNCDSNPFNHFKIQFGSNTFNGKFGDFFEADCNATVDKMFDSSAGGSGGGGAKTYMSAVRFEEYERDFE